MTTNCSMQSVQHAVEVLQNKLDPEGYGERYHALEWIRPWLEERGYYLYHHFYDVDEEYGIEFPAFSYPHFQGEEPDSVPQLPYSFYGGGCTYKDRQHTVQSPVMFSMIYAQDTQRRHVALKLMKENSVEYEAYRRLSQEKSLYTSDPVEFGCVIPPLDFVDVGDGWWFVVMPRWGTAVLMPRFDTIREVLYFMRSCLKGLCVLHKHLILYRDIKPSNILVNHFSQGMSFNDEYCRPGLRRDGRLSYALVDFDWSLTLPLDSKLVDTRLPADESFIWSCSVASDTSQGELDYNPFAFDVGSMGMFFCEQFQHLSTMVPMLAPFLDRMITRDVSMRFTATQALAFFDDRVLLSLSSVAFDGFPPPRDNTTLHKPEIYDRWAGLDPAFVKSWEAYRLPPLNWSTKTLRWICSYSSGQYFVRSIRRTIRILKLARISLIRRGSWNRT